MGNRSMAARTRSQAFDDLSGSASLFRVLVIADNCTDGTAAVARDSGARVVERFDSEKKSKGYAIEYLIGELRQSGEFVSYDALVVIDADTTIDRDLLRYFDQD